MCGQIVELRKCFLEPESELDYVDVLVFSRQRSLGIFVQAGILDEPLVGSLGSVVTAVHL